VLVGIVTVTEVGQQHVAPEALAVAAAIVHDYVVKLYVLWLETKAITKARQIAFII